MVVYEPVVESLLDRVIDEYGFIVSGWSAEWDKGLRAAFERCQSRRHTTFWASRNPPRQDAARVIEPRGGEFVQVKDPDTFSTSMGLGLASLEGPVSSPGSHIEFEHQSIQCQVAKHRIPRELMVFSDGEAWRARAQI